MRYFNFVTSAVVGVTGKDARRYLNARLTCNVKDLQSKCFTHAAQLTAQGKCQGTFTLINLDDSKFLLLSSYAPIESILSNFRQFIVADRVDTSDHSSEYKYLHLSLEQAEYQEIFKFLEFSTIPTDGVVQISNSGVIGWANNRGFESGFDLVIPTQIFSEFVGKEFTKSAIELTDEQMLIGRVKTNSVEFPVDIDNLIFSEASVSKFISFTKGCYVGQEVIERIDAMGKTAWKIVPYTSTQFVTPKTQLNDNLGSIINCSTAKIDGVHYGFARIKNAANIDSTFGSADGIEVKILGL